MLEKAKAASLKQLTPAEIEQRLTQPRECSKCHKVYPPEDFGMNPIRHWCRDCKSAHYRGHAKKRSDDRTWIPYKYGITKEEYDIKLVSQGSACCICLRPRKEGERWFAVDHDHRLPAKDPRSHRGLLCGLCNTGIGAMKDDIDALSRAIEYLRFHKIRLDKLLDCA